MPTIPSTPTERVFSTLSLSLSLSKKEKGGTRRDGHRGGLAPH